MNDQEKRWNNLYKLGGISAYIIAVLLFGEIFVYALIPNPNTPLGYIELFQENPLYGLLHFDLLGMISYLFFIPMTLAIYMALRKTSDSIVLIATVLFFLGVAVFFATNTAFSILSLSKQYAIVESEAEKTMLLASCHSLVTLFKVQAFMVSYVLVSAAWVMFASVMLQSDVFSRFTAWIGVLAGAAGIAAEVFENTSKALLMAAIICYFAAIVYLFLWVILTGRRLCILGELRD